MTAIATYLLLRAFCDELARCGLQHAATAPGSRSAPLVLSLVREPRITCWSHIDERCAGFFALGAAKASGRPAVVATTSGTAAANVLPAVIEAQQARVPLIVLTADRPPELRDVGAGQTIDQLKLYGDAVKWFFEVGVHEADDERRRWIRALACRAYWTALEPPAGPVHLNFPLREPLITDEPLPGDDSGRGDGRPYVTVQRAEPATPHTEAHPTGRIVIVAGAGAAAEVATLAAQAEIPLLADPLSGARRGPAAIAHYDLLLRNETFAASHKPQFVIRVGDLPTSKPLRAWLVSLDAAQIAVDPDRTWQDPDALVGMRIASLPRETSTRVESGWLASWRAADARAADAIADTLGDDLSEPLVAARLYEWLPPEVTLFVASSMPIRDVESFAPARDQPPKTLSNRGANGIDGTISSAFGAAAAGKGLLVLLTGDLAVLHDLGGLLAAKRLGLTLTIVVLNNDGGGIFHFLPVASQQDAFEEHVATPHGLDLERAASFFGCRHELPTDVAALRAAVERSARSAGTTLIEVRTDRTENLELHGRLAEAVQATLTRATAG